MVDAETGKAEDSRKSEGAPGAGLAEQRWNLRFTPAIETSYEADQNSTRNNDLVRYGVVAILVYDLFLINDWYIRPEIFSTAVIWRGIATVYSYSVLALIWRGLSNKLREFLITTTVVVVTVCSGTIFYSTTTNAAIYDPFVFSLIFMVCNTLLPLRFHHALWSSLVNLAVTMTFVSNHEVMPDVARLYITGLLTGTVVLTLLACYRLEQSSRQSYLLRWREERRSETAQRAADEFALQSRTDPLTQLANRRALEETIARYCRKTIDDGQVTSLLMIDIDHFKPYNDNKGHLAGDDCLNRVAKAMQSQLRDTDFISRFGGEEFVVLLPRSDRESTMLIAERLRESVARQGIEYQYRKLKRTITISIGAVVAGPELVCNQERLIEMADAALYAAKYKGRNCCVLAS